MIPVEGVIKCKVGFLMSTYWGLPLGTSFKAKATWDPVIERVERKLSG